MTLTLAELKDRLLATTNPEELLEKLDISSEELLNRFEDKLEERYEKLITEFSEEEESAS